MQTGIIVQHGHVPERKSRMVRNDITAIIGVVPSDLWPEGYECGDFIEILLRREQDIWSHPLKPCFSKPSLRAVRNFFVNGGEVAHFFGVCIEGIEDFRSPLSLHKVMGALLDRLRSEEDIAIINVPIAAYLPYEMNRRGEIRCDSDALYSMLLSHCREMNNRFLIMDAPDGLHETLILRWLRGFREANRDNASYGAIYYPWLYDGEERFPPGSAMAGVFVRVEREHPPIGIHWPPANIIVRGATHIEVELDWDEAGELAAEHINPLVIQAGRGIVVFGVRTLSMEPAFQFINSRRILNMVVEQVRRDNLWAVFETNNPHLWHVLDRDIRYRLDNFWDAGMLSMGEKGQKFAVTCNATNNPQQLRDAGYVNVEIRLQPVGATEQVVIDLNIGANL
jgi:uncharacterized protein